MLRAAALRRVSLAPAARSAHAQATAPQADAPERRSLDPAWVPLYTTLAALPSRQPPGAAAAVLDAWIRERRPLSQDQIVAYVRKLRCSSKSCALELMDWMEARGAKFTLGHHALRLNLVSTVKGIHAAEEYFWSLPDIFKSVKTYSSLLNCYAEHSSADKGLELYEKMKAMNFDPSTLVYNNLMSLYHRSGYPEKIPTIYKEMSESGVCPNNFTLTMLVKSYIKLNDLESAGKLLEELQKVTPVHWSLYTRMAVSCVNIGLFDKAEMALKKAEQEWQSINQQYNAGIANIMIAAYLDKGMIDEAEALRQSAMAQRRCTDKMFSMFVVFYLTKSKVKEALQILRERKKMLRRHKWVPTKVFLQRFLKHFEEIKDVDGMESLCVCLKEHECLDAEAYKALMRTYISAVRKGKPKLQNPKPMSPPASFAGARLLLRRLLSTATEAVTEAAAPASNAAAKAAKKKGARPLYRQLSALGKAGEGSVSRVMNKWVREGGTVRVEDLVKHVKDLRKYKRHAHALEVKASVLRGVGSPDMVFLVTVAGTRDIQQMLMDWMVNARGMNMSHTNHAIRLDLIHKVRGIQAAENYFDDLPDPAKNHRTYGALLNCYCSEKMEEKAADLYRKMDELGITSSTLPINNLMTLYMKLGQHRKVDSLFEEMKVKNVKPVSLTCCILMTSYAASNKIDAIEELLKEMAEKDVDLQWSAYSTLASIYVNANLVEKAESALKKLEELVCDSDDRQPFDFLMSLYASAGNLSEVNRVWGVIKAKFFKVTNTSYLGMLQALYKLNDLDRLKQIFEEWESSYEAYDMRLTNMMIRAHLKKHKDAEGAERFCKCLRTLGCIDGRAYESLLRTYLAAGKTNRSLRQQIKDDKIEICYDIGKLLKRMGDKGR
ncbi:hypothetical protein EJB05_57976, partial [Eragrostis curvula]